MQETHFIHNGTIIPIVGAITLSTGDGLETKNRFGYDYSKSPQSLVYRRRNTALNATIQMAYNATQVFEDTEGYDLMSYTSLLEELCGQKVTLVWNSEDFGDFIITQVQFSSQIDPLVIFPQMAVSINLTEGRVRRATKFTNVATLYNANA